MTVTRDVLEVLEELADAPVACGKDQGECQGGWPATKPLCAAHVAWKRQMFALWEQVMAE